MKKHNAHKFTVYGNDLYATVTPGHTVTVWWGETGAKTFKVGDPASYIGTEKFNGLIEKIGPKTVTVRNVYNHRVSLLHFILANT
jgi:hypothetical protein